MSYSTQQAMIDRYGEAELVQLTDRSGAGTIDAVVLGRALDDADAEINGYLAAAGIALPLERVPTSIERLAAEMGRYYLYDEGAPDEVVRRYEAAVRTLEKISAGKVSLGPDDTGAEVAPVGAPETDAPERVFTADSLADY